MNQQSTKRRILQVLAATERALAVHEFELIGVSENNIATRLSEMAKAGLVIGTRRPGQAFKEWQIPVGQLPLIGGAP